MAVDGVSFAIGRAEILGIVGESGSGKSQLLRAIMRLPSRDARVEGRVVWRGRDLGALGEPALRRLRGREIALVTQDASTSLNGVMTVGAQIDESLRAHSSLRRAARRRRAVELLELVGIADAPARLDDHPHRFSGGMLQRVMIAIALASAPAMLLADEPTTALDVTVQEEILALLLSLRDRLGMSIILVTHDLGVIARACERVLVMYAGRVVESGAVVSLFAEPRHPYTRGLLGSAPGAVPPRTRLRAIAGLAPAIDARPPGCAFHPRCPAARSFCAEQSPVLVEREAGRAAACLRETEISSERVT